MFQQLNKLKQSDTDKDIHDMPNNVPEGKTLSNLPTTPNVPETITKVLPGTSTVNKPAEKPDGIKKTWSGCIIKAPKRLDL